MGFIYTKSGKLAKRLYFGAVLLFEGLYYTFKNRVLADGGTFLENELPTISQDAKLVLTPNAYKAGKLYSEVPNDGTGDFTVDRNSTATYIDEDGIIRTALANVPRIDWSTGVPVISRELQSINLYDYSENFSQWLFLISGTATGSLTFNYGIAPDGTLTATRAIFNLNGGTTSDDSVALHKTPAGGYTAGQGYTISVWIKSLSVDVYVAIEFNGVAQNIVKVTSNWQRFTTFMPDLDVTTRSTQIIRLRGIYNVSSSIDVLVWGAQIEQASTASSYIPTSGTTVTRLSDNISGTTPAGVTSITETIDGIDQPPITTIPATYSLPEGNINKVTMQ